MGYAQMNASFVCSFKSNKNFFFFEKSRFHIKAVHFLKWLSVRLNGSADDMSL